MNQYLSILILSAMMLASCKAKQESQSSAQTAICNPVTDRAMVEKTPLGGMLALVIIYKTVGDYDNLVPVNLDSSGMHIASYPAPSDLKRGDKLLTPVALDGGYLFDRRGISANTAFTDYTYEEYAGMDETPSVEELMEHVKYVNPFSEMYVVKGLHNPSVEQLNAIIENGFEGCKIVISDK